MPSRVRSPWIRAAFVALGLLTCSLAVLWVSRAPREALAPGARDESLPNARAADASEPIASDGSQADAKRTPVAASDENAGEDVAPQNFVPLLVVSSVDGAPVAAATVSNHTGTAATSGADGVVMWPTAAEDERYTEELTVVAPGFLPRNFDLGASQAGATVALHPGVTFRGRVVGIETAVQRNACNVSIDQSSFGNPHDPGVSQRVDVDEAGEFTSPPVRALVDVSVSIRVEGCGETLETIQSVGGERFEFEVCGGGIVWGRVDKPGLQGIEVRAFGEFEPEFGAHRVLCGDDGRFRIAGLPLPGTYELVARFGWLEIARSSAFVLDARRSRLEVTMSEARSGSALEIEVVDGRGRGIDEVGFRAEPPDGTASPNRSIPYLSDTHDGGRAVVGPLPTGTWEIEANVTGFLKARQRVVIADASPGPLRFVLERNVLINGRVVTSSGEPVGNVHVVLSVPGRGPYGWSTGQSNQAGYFFAGGLPRGVAFVRAYGSGDRPGRARMGAIDFGEMRTDAGDLALVLPEPCIVRGRCLPPPDVDEVVDCILIGQYSCSVALDAGGAFSLAIDPPGAPCDLAVLRADGRSAVKRSLHLERGVTVDIGDLSTATVALSGTVVDPDGRAIAEAEVRLLPTQGRTLTTTSDRSGRYHFASAPNVPARINVFIQSELCLWLDVDDLAAENPLTLRLPRDAQIELFAAWGSAHLGRPRIRAERIDEPMEGSSSRSVAPRTDGLATSLELQAGEYQLFARFMGTANWIAGPRITAKAGETQRVEWKID